MPPLKSILVMADRSADAQVALQKAFVIARHFQARIELLACDPDESWIARGPDRREAGAVGGGTRRLDSRRFLEALRSTISADDLQLHASDEFDGPLHEVVARAVRAAGHNLVVKRVGRRDGRRRPALEAADWQLIHACPVPMMLTRGRPWRPQPRFVASVGQPGSGIGATRSEVLEVARYLASGCQGALEIVHDGEVDPAMAGVTGAMPIAAPAEIDMVVLRACGRIPGGSPHGQGPGAPLAERIIETLDCDVLLLPSFSPEL